MQQRAMRTIRWVTCLFGLALAGACDDDSGDANTGGAGPSPSNGSGVSGSKSVAETTTDDVRKLCVWMATTIGDVDISDEQKCVADALDEGINAADCATEVDSCVEERSSKPEPQPNTEDCDSLEKPEFGASCSKVTVKDFETCVGSLKTSFERYVNGLSCAENAGDRLAIPSVAACQKIYEDCPEIPLPRPEL